MPPKKQVRPNEPMAPTNKPNGETAKESSKSWWSYFLSQDIPSQLDRLVTTSKPVPKEWSDETLKWSWDFLWSLMKLIADAKKIYVSSRIVQSNSAWNDLNNRRLKKLRGEFKRIENMLEQINPERDNKAASFTLRQVFALPAFKLGSKDFETLRELFVQPVCPTCCCSPNAEASGTEMKDLRFELVEIHVIYDREMGRLYEVLSDTEEGRVKMEVKDKSFPLEALPKLVSLPDKYKLSQEEMESIIFRDIECVIL